ncbi:MAG: YfiR family protein [Opitutaceae bacterium]|nr:YfiR family protein [Opitutaceae bacterium]
MPPLNHVLPLSRFDGLTRRRGGFARWPRVFAFVGLVFACMLAGGKARASEAQEAAVKAAGLFKIISFVEWPASAFSTSDAPLVVGVVGRDPIANLIESFAEGETWHGRKVVVRPFSSSRMTGECHVLFVGLSEQSNWSNIRSQCVARPILTISDASQFARMGGIVQLATERNRLHLIVNVGVARESGVTISSKVLRLAEIVGDPRP